MYPILNFPHDIFGYTLSSFSAFFALIQNTYINYVRYDTTCIQLVMELFLPMFSVSFVECMDMNFENR